MLGSDHASSDADFAVVFLQETIKHMSAAGYHCSCAAASFDIICKHFHQVLCDLRSANSAPRTFHRRGILDSGKATPQLLKACLFGGARTCQQWRLLRAASCASLASACAGHAYQK